VPLEGSRGWRFKLGGGGEIYEETRDGDKLLWGVIRHWSPPDKVALSWHPGCSDESAQTIEVIFRPDGHGARVELIHSGWERLGEEAAALRGQYAKEWDRVFTQSYARAIHKGG